MQKPKFSLAACKDPATLELVSNTDHKTLAVWAIDCAERVMPYFEETFPQDHRPRQAIETLQRWIETGVFKMAVIRKASLDSHAAARSAAHAAGQAVATAHVPMHSLGGANYALQAIHRDANPAEIESTVAKEREWQLRHLLKLSERWATPTPMSAADGSRTSWSSATPMEH